jgi:hypothetical protein
MFWTGDGGCVNDIRAYADAEAAATKVSDLLVAHLSDMRESPNDEAKKAPHARNGI